jgi:hypothetical protein
LAGEVAQTIYTHVSKCKNDKMRKQKSLSPPIVLIPSNEEFKEKRK